VPPPPEPSTPALRGPASATDATARAAPQVRPVKSEALFAGAPELLIEHRGALYRLRQTALGKLILTK
jgi:hemin uptake protein HemP